MMDVVAAKYRNQDGSVKELPHSEELTDALFTFAINHVGNGLVGRGAVIDPNAAFLYQEWLGTDGPESDLVAVGFDEKVVAGFEAEFIAEGFGDNDATGSVDLDPGSHECHWSIGNTKCKWHCTTIGAASCATTKKCCKARACEEQYA
jgi:hypothetical protein